MENVKGQIVMAEICGEISDGIVSGNVEEVKSLTRRALDLGGRAQEIMQKGLLPGMDTVGQRFKAGEVFIPEVLASAETMHAAMEILRPFLSESDAAGLGTIIIGTVEGDFHDIGKNLVAMMFEGAGFKVIDLGTDVKASVFVEATQKHKATILGMSALLTATMPKMEETINALKEAGIRDQITVMAGGAPVTQDFVDDIGADLFGPNATVAVEKAKALVPGTSFGTFLEREGS